MFFSRDESQVGHWRASLNCRSPNVSAMSGASMNRTHSFTHIAIGFISPAAERASCLVMLRRVVVGGEGKRTPSSPHMSASARNVNLFSTYKTKEHCKVSNINSVVSHNIGLSISFRYTAHELLVYCPYTTDAVSRYSDCLYTAY